MAIGQKLKGVFCNVTALKMGVNEVELKVVYLEFDVDETF